MTEEQIIRLEDLKKEFYARYSNDGAYDLIEEAYRLGYEVGYDEGYEQCSFDMGDENV